MGPMVGPDWARCLLPHLSDVMSGLALAPRTLSCAGLVRLPAVDPTTRSRGVGIDGPMPPRALRGVHAHRFGSCRSVSSAQSNPTHIRALAFVWHRKLAHALHCIAHVMCTLITSTRVRVHYTTTRDATSVWRHHEMHGAPARTASLRRPTHVLVSTTVNVSLHGRPRGTRAQDSHVWVDVQVRLTTRVRICKL